MTDQTSNLCVRCGKPRIMMKTWKEYIKGSVLTHTLTACLDAACQKIVDKKFADQKERAQRALAHKR